MESPRPDALIETIHVAPDGSIALWAEHAQRMSKSANALGFAPVPSDLKDHVWAAVQCAVTASRNECCTGQCQCAWRVRMLYKPDGTLAIEATVLPQATGAPIVAWASACLPSVQAGVVDSTQQLLRHKTPYRPWYASGTAWLSQHPDVFDLLYVNERGAVCEGSRTNVYAQLGGQWLTPPVEDGCLPGTMRASLLARHLVRCATLMPEDIRQADALRLSNGLRGWFDVLLKA